MEIKLCYFNGYWNPYIYSTNPSKLIEENVENKKVVGGTMRLTNYKHEEIPCLYSFGLTVDNPKHAPGHGGEWSSNSYEVNKVFKTDLKEVGVDGMSMAVSLEWLKSLITDKVEEWGTIVNGEFPVIKAIKNEMPENMKWISVYKS